MTETDEYEQDEYGTPDEWMSVGCDTPGCVMPGSHYRSECHTAEDMEAYYDIMEDA